MNKLIVWLKGLDWLLAFVLGAVIVTSLRQALGTGEAAYKLSGDMLRSILSGATSDILWLACLALVWRYGISFWSQLTVICAILISAVGNFYIDAQVAGYFFVAGLSVPSALIIMALDVLPTLAAFSIFETLIHARKKIPEVIPKTEIVLDPVYKFEGSYPALVKRQRGRPKKING